MYKILIADDEVIERRVLHKRLMRDFSGENLAVYEAANGREVLEIWHREHPSILILDIEMPGISGLQAAEEIRREDREASIIFLTAFDDFSYAKRAIGVRALDYLLKPCDDAELQAAVSEAMRIADGKQSELQFGAADAAASREGSGTDTSAGTALHDAGNTEKVPDGSSALPGSRDSSNSLADLSDDGGRTEDPQAGDDNAAGTFEQQARAYIASHFMRDLSVHDISSSFGYSEAYFCKLFKQYFGRSFVTFLTDYRIRRAEELLSQKALSVAETGAAVGYPDPNYFAKVFRRIAGVSPKDYRDTH